MQSLTHNQCWLWDTLSPSAVIGLLGRIAPSYWPFLILPFPPHLLRRHRQLLHQSVCLSTAPCSPVAFVEPSLGGPRVDLTPSLHMRLLPFQIISPSLHQGQQ